MKNMLSLLQDAMVIFAQPDLVEQIARFRSHAVNRTVVVPLLAWKLVSDAFLA
jgi:hypothetical protein